MRRISFPARLDLAYQVMRGIGMREAVLIALAVGQAIWLVFVVEALPFVTRVTLAVLLAIALIALATIPIRGYKMEHYLLIVLRGLIRPKVYLHQTARAAPIEVAEQPVAAPPPSPSPPDFRSLGDQAVGEWAAPSVLVVMLLFLGLMALSAVLMYLASGGQLPGLRELRAAAPAGGGW